MRSAVKMLVTLVTVLLLVFVAGCIPAPAEITPAPAPTPEPTPTPQPTPIPTGEKVNFRFLISDEENAIGDFEQLWVHITSIGVQKGGDSGNWTEFTPDITKVDLKLLVGENATEIWSGYVEPGEYNKVFIHVDNVTGILDGAYGGGTANVTLPSDKLQISKPFTLSPDLTVNFVFDITVVEAGKSGKYILKPQIGQSGHDKPFNLVTAHGKPEDTGKPEGVDTTPPVISLTGVDTTPPVINVTGLPDGVVGEEYEAEVEATGGTGSYTWSIIPDGDLPDGLELDPDDGEISGTPEAGSEGDYTFTIQVEDDSAQTDTREFTIHIEIGS